MIESGNELIDPGHVFMMFLRLFSVEALAGANLLLRVRGILQRIVFSSPWWKQMGMDMDGSMPKWHYVFLNVPKNLLNMLFSPYNLGDHRKQGDEHTHTHVYIYTHMYII